MRKGGRGKKTGKPPKSNVQRTFRRNPPRERRGTEKRGAGRKHRKNLWVQRGGVGLGGQLHFKRKSRLVTDVSLGKKKKPGGKKGALTGPRNARERNREKKKRRIENARMLRGCSVPGCLKQRCLLLQKKVLIAG